MKQIGKIIKTDGEFAFAQVEKESSCSGDCSSCSMCNMGKTRTVKVYNKCRANEGETVYIVLETKKSLFLAFILYVMPLILFFLSYAAFESEVISVILMISGFFIFSFLGNLLSKKKIFMSQTERIENFDN